MILATKAQFLALTQRRLLDVPLPGGLTLRIRSLTEKERSEFDASVLVRGKGEKFTLDRDRVTDARQRLIVLCACDEAGEPLFHDRDLPLIQQLDSGTTQILYDACARHVGLSKEDLEELVKNSASVPVADSPSV